MIKGVQTIDKRPLLTIEDMQNYVSGLEIKNNELKQQLDKYKNVIDKIKEYITEDYNDYKNLIDKDNITDLNDSFWQGVVITSRDILELLEEVE